MNRSALPILGFTLPVVAFGLVAIASRFGATDISHAAMVFAGFLFAAAASTFSTYLKTFENAPAVKVSFDEVRTRKDIDDIIDAEFKEVPAEGSSTKDELYEKEDPWELRGDILVGQDPNLALAKLRIDLERELRRIAFAADIPISSRTLSIGRLLGEIARRGILDERIIHAIRDILPACNEAVHGGNVSRKLAASVLAIGQDVLTLLRSNSSVKTSSQSSIYSEL